MRALAKLLKYPFIILLVAVIGIAVQRRFLTAANFLTDNIPWISNLDAYVDDAGGRVVNLSGQQLSRLPDFVLNNPAVEELVLDHNQITSLPAQIGNLSKLRVLNLNNNQLTGELPGEIRLLPLKELSARSNRLSGIPAEIGQINSLIHLDLSHNQITDLPDELTNLTRLKTLNLTGNPIPTAKIDQLREKMPSTTIVF